MIDDFEVPEGKAAESSVPLHPLLAARWSPRALDPAAELDEVRFRALFEAARWAPSWGNTQPARFLAARRGEPAFERIRGTLSRGNRGWTEAAAALAIGVAQQVDDEGEPLPYGEYGVALAAQNLVLQAVSEGFAGHQMAGFDRDAVRAGFGVPPGWEPVVAIAIGGLGSPDGLPDRLRDKERAPRTRKPLSDLVFGERWGSARY